MTIGVVFKCSVFFTGEVHGIERIRTESARAANRTSSARNWLSANREQLSDPEIIVFLVERLGVTQGAATFLVNMAKLGRF